MPSTTPTPTVAELEARVLDGDPAVSAEDLAAARARDEFAELRAQAATRAQAQHDEQVRAHQLAQLRADVEQHANHSEHLVALLDAVFAAADNFAAGLDHHRDEVRTLARRAGAAGIPASVLASVTPADDHTVMWSAEGVNGGPAAARVSVGRRTVTAPDRNAVLAALLGELSRRTGMSRNTPLRHNVATGHTAALLRSIERTTPAPETMPVRLVVRWGQHRPGQAVTVDRERGEWLVRTRRAVPVQQLDEPHRDEHDEDGPTAA